MTILIFSGCAKIISLLTLATIRDEDNGINIFSQPSKIHVAIKHFVCLPLTVPFTGVYTN